jgi:small subunit ribosomal protein S5
MQRVKSTQDLELKERLVAVNRVTKVTKGGRTFTFGKAGEVAAAMQKATEAAKKNLIQVPVLKGTIPHEQFAKFGGSRVYIQPATHGTGVKAGGAMRAVLESAGVHDVLAKSKGSSNPHNLVKATIQALAELRDARTVAANRGVSLSTVFNG